MKDFILPIVAIIVNVGLGANLHMPLFYVAAAVIFVLFVLKIARTRGGNKTS